MTKTKNYYGTPSNYTDHTRYGGKIYAADFETDYHGNQHDLSTIAERIINDIKFDEQCRKNRENPNNQKYTNHSWKKVK